MADWRNLPQTVIFLVSKFELLVAELAITVSCLQISNARRKFPKNTHPANMSAKDSKKSANENPTKVAPFQPYPSGRSRGHLAIGLEIVMM